MVMAMNHCLIGAVAATLVAFMIPRDTTARGVTEWSAEVRTTMGFKVNERALQPFLPDGWTIEPSSGATNRGANLTVTVMERQVVLDPQGRPLKTGSSRYTVLTVPAKNVQSGQVSTMAIMGISPEGAGAYGVYETATISRVERTTEGAGEENGRARERWEFASSAGNRIAVTLAYRRGPATRARAETRIRSAKTPDFTRTYRIEQATDLVRSAVTNVNRLDEWTFEASGPRLGAIFDGTQTLLSVTVVPSYVREISIP
jgi:hypothetical protein